MTSTEQRPSNQLVAKFKKGDVVRWNALCGPSDMWTVEGLEVKESLLPIYRIRKGGRLGSAVQSELELQPMQPCVRGNDDCPKGCCK